MFDIKTHGKWLALAVAAVPVVYLSMPSFNMGMASSTPQQHLIEARQIQNIAPQQNLFPTPTPQTAVLLPLDALARAVITQSEDITLTRLQTQLEEERAKKREASQRGVKADAATQNRATTPAALSYIDTVYETTSRAPAIEKITLNGLITTDNKTVAYLSFDNAAPTRVQLGDKLAGVQVTRIDTKRVTLRQGKTTRTLEGQ